VSSCLSCHVGPEGHPRVDCPLCDWPSFAHLPALRLHLSRHHSMFEGTRAYALALEVGRNQVRGWPTDGVALELREALQLSGVHA
jgi:hypothetical protein